jgi:hypothetical protein
MLRPCEHLQWHRLAVQLRPRFVPIDRGFLARCATLRDVVPPYCTYAHESFEFGPPPKKVWDEPPEKKFRQPGNVGASKYLARGLIEGGFDAAYSYKPLHHPLGHAFANALLYVDYDRKGFACPIIPFAINCYGRKVIAQRGDFPQVEFLALVAPTSLTHPLAV